MEEEKARALGLQRRERELRQRLLSLLLGRRPTSRADPAPPGGPAARADADDLLRPVLDILHRVTHARAPRDADPKAPAEPAAPAQVLACIRENAPSKPGVSPTREPLPPPPRDCDDHDKCNREPGREGRSRSRGGEGGGRRRRRQHGKRAHADDVDTEEEEEERRRREKDKERGRERKHSRHGRHSRSRSRSRSPRRRGAWNR